MTRFIILAPARSGSSLLTLELRRHIYVEMWGEVFHATGDYWLNRQFPNVSKKDYANGASFARFIFGALLSELAGVEA